MNPNIFTGSVVLGSNETRNFATTGQYFACPSASAPFQISIDGGPFINITPGTGFPVESVFTNIIFKDTSGGGCTITFFTGSKGVTYQAPTIATVVTNAATYTKGSGDVAIAAGESATYSGLDGAKVRKQIVVTNIDPGPGNPLLVQDGSGNTMFTLYATQSKTIETSGVIKVKNPNGGAVTHEAGETFYS